MIDSPYRLQGGQKFRLKDINSSDTGPFKSKEACEQAIATNLEKLRSLQPILYAEGKRSLLIILQGMDTSGKDGTVKHVFSGVNPQGCSVVSFKAPSAEELAHDYLWRVHAHTPAKGMIAIFNRSHYESVLVERVHSIVPKPVWSRRYDQINHFERMLVDEGTTILKFFLHISRKEQKQRLEARLHDPEKNWKLDERDLAERKLWDDYQQAYEDALRQCSTEAAPWYVAPADHKWFRNWVVSDVIVRELDQMKLRYPEPPKGIERWKIE